MENKHNFSHIQPILIDRNFIEFLNEEQLKVIGAILASNQQKSSFPLSDRSIAFFGGFNDIKIVEKIKKSLEDIGLLKKDMTLDFVNWERNIKK